MLNLKDKTHRRLLAEFDRVVAHSVTLDDNDSPALLVAFSGGLDSHVLLLVAMQWCVEHPHAVLRAVTIDHGLQKAAAAWSQHCAAVCQRSGICFDSYRVDVDLNAGLSPEQAARDARYQALQAGLRQGEYLMTAHHADDQAETVMLQLLRGAGVRGLSAMPERKFFGQGFHLRPLLSLARAELLQVAQDLNLQWIEDPSNADVKFDRNLLRNEIMPLLRERWPAMSVNLSRSAAHCARSAALNHELAHLDLGAAVKASVLSVQLLKSLQPLRRQNALRVWIEQHGYLPPSTAQLERIDVDLVHGSAESAGQVCFGSAEIRRYSGNLYLAERKHFMQVPAFNYTWENRRVNLLIEETGQLLSASDLNLPWLDDDQVLQVRSRAGGERIRLNAHKHSHSVKSLLQQNRVPPWQRDRLPLIYLDGCLVGIVGIGFSGKPESYL